MECIDWILENSGSSDLTFDILRLVWTKEPQLGNKQAKIIKIKNKNFMLSKLYEEKNDEIKNDKMKILQEVRTNEK